MKGAGTLLLLVSLAVVAGLILILTRGRALPEPDPSDHESPPAELYVENAIGLPFQDPPLIEAVGQEILLQRVGAYLDGQFGPGGLVRRTRALELLGFSDTAGRNLRDEMIAMEVGGVRGWFDEPGGRLLVPADFDQENIFDRVVLHGLLTRLLVSQHAPPTIGRLSDDDWIARRAMHQAVAESVEAKLRREHREAFALPTPRQTEREAILLGLPIYLHQLAQLPLENGPARVFFETRVRTGARALGELVREPPVSTFELLGGDPSLLTAPPRLPTLAEPLLEESLGAFATQALLEWLDSFEQARALALLWRGDRYRLIANSRGDHILWVCRWESPEAARRAGEILSRATPANQSDPRVFSVTVHGNLTVLANCSDPDTMQDVKNLNWTTPNDQPGSQSRDDPPATISPSPRP